MAPLAEYRYVPSCELQKAVVLRVSSLLGSFDRCYNGRRPLPSDMCVRISVYCSNRRVGPIVQTEYRPPVSSRSTERHKWGETLELPLRYSELSKDAFLLISLWAADRNHGEIFVAQCIEPMFSKHGALHSGQREVRLIATPSGKPEPFYKPDEEPRTTLISAEPRSPSSPNLKELPPFVPEPLPSRSSRTSKAIPTIEELTKQEKKYKENLLDTSFLDQLTFSKLANLRDEYRKEDNHLYLVIEYPPAYNDKESQPYVIVYYFAEDDVQNQARSSLGHQVTSYHDRDLGFENLHELKHQMLTRNTRAVEVDRLLVPNPKTKIELEEIINAPSSAELTVEKRDLIWKFRYFLQDNAKALTKFVRSVNWAIDEEQEQAQKIIEKWSPISIYDVLELLGPDFPQPFIRKYAVSRLRESKSSDEEILLYLPQLVQALRYEHPHDDRESRNELVNYLVDVAAESFPVANFLFWYLKVEIDATHQVDSAAQLVFLAAQDKLRVSLSRGPSQKYQVLKAQEKFVQILNDISKLVAEASGNIEKKTEVLRKALSESTELQNQLAMGLSLPVDPSVKIKAVVPNKAHLFKSSQMPMSLTFQVQSTSSMASNDNYTVIFKRGDDLRQDQLIMQMIHIMDNILKAERLNLYLTPYAILATSLNEGFVQYVRATPVADLDKLFPGANKQEYIQLALQKYRPSSTGIFGIEQEAMDRFLRSSAGYCVISYILGIGDRHLHNVLLCEDGRIFHIDFGYVLGRDPKPLPPPMKISPSMVYAMGGMKSQQYKQFVEYCRTAFTFLQQHAKLITNLFGLMLDAGIPDIAIEKDKAVQKVLERFHLNLEGDSDAIAQLLDNLIESSIKAIMPLISDFVHGFAH